MPGGCIRVPKNPDPKALREFLRRCTVALCGGCDIQYRENGEFTEAMGPGWPCRTCFFCTLDILKVPSMFKHPLWLAQLAVRNDGSTWDGYVVTTTPTPEQAAHEAKALAYRKATYGENNA